VFYSIAHSGVCPEVRVYCHHASSSFSRLEKLLNGLIWLSFSPGRFVRQSEDPSRQLPRGLLSVHAIKSCPHPIMRLINLLLVWPQVCFFTARFAPASPSVWKERWAGAQQHRTISYHLVLSQSARQANSLILTTSNTLTDGNSTADTVTLESQLGHAAIFSRSVLLL
jgi:hypothetical protein